MGVHSAEITDGPAVFELHFLMASDGVEEALAEDSAYLDDVREATWDRVLSEGAVPLPDGTVRALVCLDEFGRFPHPDEVGRDIARLIGGRSC
jgi:hypothetical protein